MVSGIGYLYEDVVLRRFHQIPAFFQTMEANLNLRKHVKGATLAAVIPAKYGRSVARHLQRIIDICPISKYALTPSCELPDNLLLPALGPNITHLEFNALVSATDTLILLDLVRKTLSSLSIHVHNRSSPKLPASQKVCELSQLESIFYDLSQASPNLDHSIGGFLVNLRCLTITRESNVSFGYTEGNLYIDSFCKRHGRSLRDLHLHYTLERGQFIGELQDVCPSLEHLVISSQNLLERFSHPNVKWVDIWHPPLGYYTLDWCPLLPHQLPNRQIVPKLQYVREISDSLLLIRDISLTLDPRSNNSSDAFEFRFPGIYLPFSAGTFTGGHYIQATDWDSDHDDDEDYVFDDRSESDSDGWSQTSSECSLEDFDLDDAFDDPQGADSFEEEEE
ncbi:hypothetical protein DXG03_005580 [Asterophora parasitica]|uniref:Uncharacterized protein n=1 Tax=Asterophora parasitica TaxID=117018 RepID=A0A9P7K7H0_9AGAR|nr:hypothetical protein DXG03_005580 [Asterophora parasitica]